MSSSTRMYQDDMYDDDRVVTLGVAEQRMAAYRQNFNAEAADATQLMIGNFVSQRN